MQTVTPVTHRGTGTIFLVDESKNLAQMQLACPRFFKNKHGKRESYSDYRGCLIVRNTKRFSDGSMLRDTTVYAFYTTAADNIPDMFCISVGSDNNCDNVRKAKKLIDAFLDGGVYFYGFYQ